MDRQEVAKGRFALWKNYILLVYTAAALAVLLGVVNLIIFDHNVRWDLTPNKRYSLSEFDKHVLGGLNHPVKVMAFVRTEDPAYLELAELLFQVATYTPMVTYQVIDVNKAPGLARQYGVSTYGEVIVESEGRRRDFDNARSDLLIPAVLQISHVSNKHIYFTVGHGERDLFDSDRTTGYSQWRGTLYRTTTRSITCRCSPAACPTTRRSWQPWRRAKTSCPRNWLHWEDISPRAAISSRSSIRTARPAW